jgi:hypothetical protein
MELLRKGNRLPPLTVWELQDKTLHIMPVTNISHFSLSSGGRLDIHTTSGGRITPMHPIEGENWSLAEVMGFWSIFSGDEYDPGEGYDSEEEGHSTLDAVSNIPIPQDWYWDEDFDMEDLDV